MAEFGGIISIDVDFNFILQAIKTRRNKILKQDGYFERVVSLYNHKDFRSLHLMRLKRGFRLLPLLHLTHFIESPWLW